ncbi:tRNA pseudouridine13 synthase [Geoalkalibacter ferrihydriticus]|uniref:tRNA pseudouridine synthase D n=1 Tax=Geoalkalibacter ferrihydriticus TaxID=392333 RepID=A0A1G9ILI7_9BACT|nr:tRNA pseudouridine(13) synthase TruD [Geoalkalibacter ferrihydriticus]SDL25945.1 tRNA pseudouridine13 synthase [Geoalkalibacter ferrihydriticus]
MTPYLSAHFPGTGGHIKQTPEDFEVEELPLYRPCGEGEHLYLFVEKRGLTTLDLLRHLARAFGLRERDLGYAGLKDARALTRQWISLPGVRREQLGELDLPGVRILEADYHRNKLRLGHLAGNQFRIRIRGANTNTLETTRDVLHVLAQVGVPNIFGSQRYGVLNNSHLIGRALVAGDFNEAARQILGDPAAIQDPRWRQAAQSFRDGDLRAAQAALPRHMADERRLVNSLMSDKDVRRAVLAFPRRKLRLYLSACQSWLFDRLVAMRLSSLDVLWPGDLAYIHGKGACFQVDDPNIEQPRADKFEISPSGPLFGTKVRLATAQAGLLEESLLAEAGLNLESFRLPAGLTMEGERRPLRVPLHQPAAHPLDADLEVTFSLPRGSYATSVIREIIKDGGCVAEEPGPGGAQNG